MGTRPTLFLLAAALVALPASLGSAQSTPNREPAPNLAVEAPIHLGVSGHGGFGLRQEPSGGVSVVGLGTYGLSIAGTVHDFVTVLLRRVTLSVGYSSIEGPLVTAEGTPALELFDFADPRIQLYTQLGVSVQGRTQTTVAEGIVQVAGWFAAGARFWVSPRFSIAAELAAQLVLTDAYGWNGGSLPRFSVPVLLGVALGWHIQP